MCVFGLCLFCIPSLLLAPRKHFPKIQKLCLPSVQRRHRRRLHFSRCCPYPRQQIIQRGFKPNDDDGYLLLLLFGGSPCVKKKRKYPTTKHNEFPSFLGNTIYILYHHHHLSASSTMLLTTTTTTTTLKRMVGHRGAAAATCSVAFRRPAARSFMSTQAVATAAEEESNMVLILGKPGGGKGTISNKIIRVSGPNENNAWGKFSCLFFVGVCIYPCFESNPFLLVSTSNFLCCMWKSMTGFSEIPPFIDGRFIASTRSGTNQVGKGSGLVHGTGSTGTGRVDD